MNDNRKAVPSVEEWAAYIRGDQSVQEREAYMEEMLLENELALESYMQALELVEAELPVLPRPEGFTEMVMTRIGGSETKVVHMEARDDRRRWYEHRLFHYAIAACLTLIFLSAGWFDKLSPGPEHVKKHAREASFSEELVKVTTGWIDRLKP
ncbi:hypothetical protein RJP21_09680 [Paenibacillus sp. VCA1]|uniref:hypothetical protein n=1 Tax=Paenibacillus sp. VCA1 TaxID=3039148 RepID=UPI002871CA63|nr:hypothetical protein [Paenibacillus sp. VCA1]MDR9853872.1 hypothetical protein [Paenibacillus sp. VCA1]